MFVRNGQALGSINHAVLESRAERPQPEKPEPEPQPVAPQPEPEPETVEEEESQQPKHYDSKGDWVDWAVSQGADRDEAENLTKNELIEMYGDE